MKKSEVERCTMVRVAGRAHVVLRVKTRYAYLRRIGSWGKDAYKNVSLEKLTQF